MRGFQQIKGDLEALGARVVGVSTDTWASNGAFAEKEGIEFPLLSDWPEHRTCKAFGVLREGASVATRVTFVFDASGVVRAVIHDTTDVLEHPQRALEAARSLAGAPAT